MNISLIFPRTKYPSGDTPLGVAYLASYLRNKIDCKIKILDTTFHPNFATYIKNAFSKEKIDLVGISAMTTMIDAAYFVAEIAKSYNHTVKVLLGGPHATMMPEEALKNKNIDAVVIGEGEEVFFDFVKNFNIPEEVAGIAYRENDSIKINPRSRPLIDDLDSIPYPAWDLLEMERYKRYWFQLDSVSTDITGTSIIASRGCPYQCTYCQPTLNVLFGKKIRKRSPKNIVGELKILKNDYGIKGFNFVDDTFAIDKDWVMELCNEIIEERLNIMWLCNFRANLVDRDILKKMKEAGLVKINIGIESASQRILDEIYGKGIKLQDIKMSAEIADSLGIKIQGYFMIGAPSETQEEIRETIRLADELPLTEATFNITTPLPGTYLYRKSLDVIDKKAYLKLDYYKTSVFQDSVGVHRKKIALFKKIAFLRFYLGPKRFLSTVKLFFHFKELGKVLLKLRRI